MVKNNFTHQTSQKQNTLRREARTTPTSVRYHLQDTRERDKTSQAVVRPQHDHKETIAQGTEIAIPRHTETQRLIL